ncbi:DUF418 domain-containing protein [Fibrella forsythiae]|uniref:DUF418 domain-containing protein n=1 Tax=Fibrella forsythiae TaxID=2817061 RepID=A0ABS3JF05_9BACT|nr:DUF418 domain-containing protein [Fibrella forsythiae]MBO0948013.1 DUF418 domain-containing protein [Fibrella forsythiae]
MNPAFPSTPASPTAVSSKLNRIEVVDALRGIALFGILLVHCAQWYTAGSIPGSVYQAQASGVANSVSQAIMGIFFDGKFYTFFSFLFGLSFALMMTRSQEPSGVFYRRFAWRLIVLGIIGYLHHLLWRGDILSIYAMLGFLMLPFGKVPNTVVLVVALLLVTNVPSRLRTVYETVVSPPAQKDPKQEQKTYEQDAKAYYDVLTKGSQADLMRFNANAFGVKMRFQLDSGRIFVTLGFFLLGLYAGRRRLFQQLTENKRWFRRTTRFAGFSVLGITAIGLGLFAVFGSDKAPPAWVMQTVTILFDLQSALLTIFYIAGFALLFQRRSWQWTIGPLAAVGKMGLTSYVAQTIIGTYLFFGFGFGLLDKTTVWQATLITIPIFVGQVLFSQFWLARFRYGPLEWLWRSLTYLRLQPMRA